MSCHFLLQGIFLTQGSNPSLLQVSYIAGRVFLPGESHGQRSLAGCSPRGRKEWDTTERLHFTSLHFLTTEPLMKLLLLINLLLITTQLAPKSPPTLPKTLLSKYPSIMGISQVYRLENFSSNLCPSLDLCLQIHNVFWGSPLVHPRDSFTCLMLELLTPLPLFISSLGKVCAPA